MYIFKSIHGAAYYKKGHEEVIIKESTSKFIPPVIEYKERYFITGDINESHHMSLEEITKELERLEIERPQFFSNIEVIKHYN